MWKSKHQTTNAKEKKPTELATTIELQRTTHPHQSRQGEIMSQTPSEREIICHEAKHRDSSRHTRTTFTTYSMVQACIPRLVEADALHSWKAQGIARLEFVSHNQSLRFDLCCSPFPSVFIPFKFSMRTSPEASLICVDQSTYQASL